MTRETDTTDALTARLRAALDVEGMLATCQDLIQTPSLSQQEQEVAVKLASCLRLLGYDRVEVDDKWNVVGWIEGAVAGPSLMFNGHLDHVPPQDMQDPYAGSLVDGARWHEDGSVIYGRGSCDMKCNVVAGAYAGAAVKRAGIPLRGTYIFTADVAEEVDSPDGIQYVLRRGIRADYGVSGESTALQVYLGHRGKVEFEMTVHGRISHSSNPSRGDNAIVRMARLIEALQSRAEPYATHPMLGQGSLAITDISASPGHGVAVVPDRCTIRIDRRFIPGETPETCRRELEEIVARLQAVDPPFRCDIELVNLYPLLWIEPDHALVAAAQSARAAVMGGPGELGGWLFGVNGTFMAREGIPTVGIGPGDERWAHSPEEHIAVSEIITAAEIYARMIVDLCGEKSDGAAKGDHDT